MEIGLHLSQNEVYQNSSISAIMSRQINFTKKNTVTGISMSELEEPLRKDPFHLVRRVGLHKTILKEVRTLHLFHHIMNQKTENEPILGFGNLNHPRFKEVFDIRQ